MVLKGGRLQADKSQPLKALSGGLDSPATNYLLNEFPGPLLTRMGCWASRGSSINPPWVPVWHDR